jgi:hypothetical protein
MEQKIEQKIGEWILIGGALLFFGVTPLIAILGGVHWLKFKEWPDWSVSGFGVPTPVTSWEGANAIMNYVYHLHIGWLALLVAIVGMLVGTQLAKD